MTNKLQKLLEQQHKELDEKCISYGVDKYYRGKQDFKTWLSKKQRQIIEEVREEINTEKRRFRCAACDGAKCKHTQCCQALKNLQNNLKIK